MILPNNGSVVIIDDKLEEAIPIMNVLAKNGISSTYYRGNYPDELPNSPLDSVRLIFLDLQLIDTVDESHIAKTIVEILRKLISPENGPYLLIMWSKNGEKYGNRVENELREIPLISPIGIVKFNKRECLEEEREQKVDFRDIQQVLFDQLRGQVDPEDLASIEDAIRLSLDDQYEIRYKAKANAISIIEENIRQALIDIGAYHLFVIWENLLKRAGAKSVHSLSSIAEINDTWENNMRGLIERLAKAQTGKNETSVKAALTTLTNSFSEQLESLIRTYEIPGHITMTSPYDLALKSSNGLFHLEVFEEEGLKVRLSKDSFPIKSKEKVSLKRILTLSDGLAEPDKTEVSKLVKNYVEMPYLINTKLHIELNPNTELIPGNVYHRNDVSNERKIELLKETYFDNFDEKKIELEKYKFIELEVSPICDYAQTKWKKSRLVSGLLYPIGNNALKQGNNFYPVDPVFLIESEPYKMVFDYHLFKSTDKPDPDKLNIWFRIKRELLLDIIANLSSHVNRPGISFVS